MELEETEVELKGSAQEQYGTWRAALKGFTSKKEFPTSPSRVPFLLLLESILLG